MSFVPFFASSSKSRMISRHSKILFPTEGLFLSFTALLFRWFLFRRYLLLLLLFRHLLFLLHYLLHLIFLLLYRHYLFLLLLS